LITGAISKEENIEYEDEEIDDSPTMQM